jgi:hypothetical protein
LFSVVYVRARETIAPKLQKCTCSLSRFAAAQFRSISHSWPSSRRKRIAAVPDKVMRCKDVSLLVRDQLPDGQRQILIQCIRIRLFGVVLSPFCGS